MLQYIRTPEDLEPYAGYLHRPEPEGLTAIIAGPNEVYGPHRTGKSLNQFPTKRIQMASHTWPPVRLRLCCAGRCVV